MGETGCFELSGEKYSAVEKIPGGKLVGVEAWVDEGCVSRVKLTGDFFLHPEESVGVLEKAIAGTSVHFDSGALEKQLSSIVEEHGLVLIGVSPGAIAAVLKKALGEKP